MKTSLSLVVPLALLGLSTNTTATRLSNTTPLAFTPPSKCASHSDADLRTNWLDHSMSRTFQSVDDHNHEQPKGAKSSTPTFSTLSTQLTNNIKPASLSLLKHSGHIINQSCADLFTIGTLPASLTYRTTVACLSAPIKLIRAMSTLTTQKENHQKPTRLDAIQVIIELGAAPLAAVAVSSILTTMALKRIPHAIPALVCIETARYAVENIQLNKPSHLQNRSQD